MFRLVSTFGVIVGIAVPGFGQEATTRSPVEGHTVHVTAPHVVAGKVRNLTQWVRTGGERGRLFANFTRHQ